MRLLTLPKEIQSDFLGYSNLLNLCSKMDAYEFEDITLDFSKTEWFDVHLTAVLGAILSNAQDNFNNIKIRGLTKELKILLSRSNFLAHFGGLQVQDFYETTVRYCKFKATEKKLFREYLEQELLSKKAMPKMTPLLKNKINEGIFEIFENAVIHGNCQNIFTCGQYYLDKDKLCFTMVNLGETIKANVNNYLGCDLSGSDSIKWALVKGHTTKEDSKPGGLGLSVIREFISRNQGTIQIVSADGCWEQRKEKEAEENFLQAFPGTIVNLEFNVGDTGHYYLSPEEKISKEIDVENIF